jgi:hypothetical protein
MVLPAEQVLSLFERTINFNPAEMSKNCKVAVFDALSDPALMVKFNLETLVPTNVVTEFVTRAFSESRLMETVEMGAHNWLVALLQP